MRIGFEKNFISPCCGASLTLIPYEVMGVEVLDGLLLCDCGEPYIVHRRVPRFLLNQPVPAAFLERYGRRAILDAPRLEGRRQSAAEFSFSHQWSQHPYGDLTWELDVDERVGIFHRYLGAVRGQLANLKLLDAGCGNGTLSVALAKAGLDVIAMDYSDSVYRAAEHSSRAAGSNQRRPEFLQGDVGRPPFPPGEFDIVYADGVLHHTADTKSSFMSLSKMVKPGGQILLWLYRSDLSFPLKIKMAAVKAIRRCTAPLPLNWKMSICYVGAALILSVLRLLRVFGYRHRRVIPLKNKAVNLFDTISPTFNHSHTPHEVAAWFSEAGFVIVRDVSIHEHRLSAGGFAMLGRRP